MNGARMGWWWWWWVGCKNGGQTWRSSWLSSPDWVWRWPPTWPTATGTATPATPPAGSEPRRPRFAYEKKIYIKQPTQQLVPGFVLFRRSFHIFETKVRRRICWGFFFFSVFFSFGCRFRRRWSISRSLANHNTIHFNDKISYYDSRYLSFRWFRKLSLIEIKCRK